MLHEKHCRKLTTKLLETMKKIVTMLLACFLATPIFSQDLIAYNKAPKLNPSHSKVPSTKMVNAEYLNIANAEMLPYKVNTLRKKAANYRIENEKIFSKHASNTYKVTFTEKNNSIDVIFDSSGNIIESREEYHNIALPYSLSKEVSTNNPGWAFEKSVCNITYEVGKESKITYEVVLKKDSKTKRLSLVM